MPIDLFTPQVNSDAQHTIFKMMSEEPYGPERAVLAQWANGFEDRDGKFVRELQTTFESSFWSCTYSPLSRNGVCRSTCVTMRLTSLWMGKFPCA